MSELVIADMPKRFRNLMVMKNVFDARLCHGIRGCAIHKFYRAKAAGLAARLAVRNG